jgi:hypothetical protein
MLAFDNGIGEVGGSNHYGSDFSHVRIGLCERSLNSINNAFHYVFGSCRFYARQYFVSLHDNGIGIRATHIYANSIHFYSSNTVEVVNTSSRSCFLICGLSASSSAEITGIADKRARV